MNIKILNYGLKSEKELLKNPTIRAIHNVDRRGNYKGPKILNIDIKEAINCCGLHFLLAFCVGSLVYLLTSTILSHTLMDGVGIFSIHQFSLLLALSFAALSHILEDYLLGWF